MKRVAVFLSGLAATCTGAFIRACNSSIDIELASAWCGKPSDAASLAYHAHCAGCAIAFVGLTNMCLSTAGLVGRTHRINPTAMVIR